MKKGVQGKGMVVDKGVKNEGGALRVRCPRGGGGKLESI